MDYIYGCQYKHKKGNVPLDLCCRGISKDKTIQMKEQQTHIAHLLVCACSELWISVELQYEKFIKNSLWMAKILGTSSLLTVFTLINQSMDWFKYLPCLIPRLWEETMPFLKAPIQRGLKCKACFPAYLQYAKENYLNIQL